MPVKKFAIIYKNFLFIAIVERIWDPMSTSQTLRLVGTVNRLIREYPNLNDTSKPLETLFNAILEKIKSAVENDVFIPIFPKQLVYNIHLYLKLLIIFL